MRRLIVALLPLCALAACGRMVNEPQRAVIDHLARMPSSANVMYMAKQVPQTNFRTRVTAEGVDWTLSLSGRDICRFSAKVTEAGANASRVATAMVELGDQKETYLCDIASIAGEESVAATLEKRPGNTEEVQKRLTKYLVSHMGAAMETVSRRMDEMAPEGGRECESGDRDARRTCKKFMRARAREMREQGFAN